MARVLISIPDDFLAEVDELAGREQRSRSELIREALRRYMTAAPGPARSAAETRPGGSQWAVEQIQKARRDTQVVEGESTEAWLKARRERHG